MSQTNKISDNRKFTSREKTDTSQANKISNICRQQKKNVFIFFFVKFRNLIENYKNTTKINFFLKKKKLKLVEL